MRRLLLLFAAIGICCSVRSENPPSPVSRSLEQGLAAAVEYLVKQQSPDGSWKSDVYAAFKDGKALTPFAVVALQTADLAPEARRTGAAVLAKWVKPDGTIDEGEDGIDYPAYTASLSVIALSHPENRKHVKARDAWLKYLMDRQLTEALGWNDEDKPYGGWGYCRVLPRKPKPNLIAPPLIESNLSATVFALEALRAAGVKDGEVYRKALRFERSCQNDAPMQDGGFHFIYDDPVRNKAGAVDGLFHSYGSTTADGARALQLAGDAMGRGFGWLARNFSTDHHPGNYIPAHERNRDAVYYYYAASVAKTLRMSGVSKLGGTQDWAGLLAAELLKRQQGDGSWANPLQLVREDDPLVATGHAILALAECRAAGAK